MDAMFLAGLCAFLPSKNKYIINNLYLLVKRLLTKSQGIVVIFGAWAFLALAVLAVSTSLSFEYFFVLCLIGFLVIVELSGPFASRPRWRSRVNLVILIGVLVFSLVVAIKVIDILGITLF
jgi:hypothetical protein